MLVNFKGYRLFVLLFLIIPLPLKAYDHSVTHPRLTDWAVQVYNQKYSLPISDQQKNWLMLGAAAEDQPLLRTMHHFWWPQTNRPLSAGAHQLMSLQTAPSWGLDGRAQANLIYGSIFSWNQAILAYRAGDYQQAFINLGHVLHLLQDNSVPAHVRNDPHELGDSLENWVWQHRQQLAQRPAVVQPNCVSYQDCFRQLASAVNQHYFSQDTINSPMESGDWPNQPAVAAWPNDDGYIIYRGYKLAYYQAARRRLILDDQVQADYWAQLSPLAIGYGAELLKVFLLIANSQTEIAAEPNWWSRWSATIKTGSINQSVEILSSPVTNSSAKPVDNPDSNQSATATTASPLVKRVIDGDTIELTDGQKVRYIGIDAPEIAQISGQASQCLADEAKQRNQALLAGGILKLVADSGGDKDAYGRLLRYVYVGDLFLNQQLAAEGLAKVFFCGANQDNCPPATDQARRQLITVAGQTAKQNKLGLYSNQCSTVSTSSTAKVATTSTSVVIKVTSSSVKTISPPATTSPKTNPVVVGTTKPEVLDLIPPNTTIKTDLPAAINTGTVNFILSSTEPGKFECQLNDQNWKACATDYHLKNLVGGEYLLSVRAIDLAGNIDPTPATYAWLIDKKKPVISWLAKPSSTMAGQEAEFLVDLNEEATLLCQLDNQAEHSCQVSFSYNQLAPGQHQITVHALDPAGNYSAKLTHKWTMLGGAPDGLSIDYPPTNPWLASSTSITITGQANQASRVLVGTQVAQLSADKTWRAVVKLSAGINNFIIWPEDELGQRGPSSTTTIILDNIKPSSSVLILPETVTELGFIVEWQGTDSGDSASGHLLYDLQYRLNSDSWQPWLSAVDYTSAVFDQPVEINQKVAFRCRARDQAGNWENWPTNSAADTHTQLVAIPSGPPPKIVISQLATRGPGGASDEFVELYNPNDETVDLAGWRLQSKSAAGTTWINRSGDGLPTGSSIVAHGYFLLASLDYSGIAVPDYRHEGNWGLSDDGGHLRLISAQEYFLDKIGYNEANDPEGQAANASLAQEHSLQRKARVESTATSLAAGGADSNLGNGWDSDNNQADFVDQPLVQPRSGNQQTINQEELSLGLSHLWHFNECLGDTLYDQVGSANINNQPFGWRVGRFDCAGYQTWERPAVDLDLLQSLDPAQITLAYWWRNASHPNEGRGHEYLKSTDGQIIFGLTPSASGVLQFWRYGSNYRLDNVIPIDEDWHLLVATQDQNQLKFYVDGRLKFQELAEYSPPQPIVKLDLADENYPIDRDEIAIWQRALSLAEVRQLYQSKQPLDPYPERPAQSEPAAAYYWGFDEGVSNIAYDNLVQAQLAPVGRWIYSPFNLGVRLEHPGDLQADLPQPLENRDVSLSFWWRSSAYPNESRANIVLASQSGQPLFGLGIGTYGPKIHFNGASWYPLNLPINDGDWHQAVLVYDSYAYRLSFYLDGGQRWQSEQTWLISPLTKLFAAQDNWPLDIDELTIWQGALNASQIETIYELARPELDE